MKKPQHSYPVGTKHTALFHQIYEGCATASSRANFARATGW